MTKFLRATINDLPTLARIHKTAYSRAHFTALLPEEVLARYYGYFLDDGSEICLALNDAVSGEYESTRAESVQGFAVFGSKIPEKIARFKRECRREIFLASLQHPLSAAKKTVYMAASMLRSGKSELPAEFLLLSIAVASPRRGIGTQLLGALLETARLQGHKTVGLYVNVGNVSAINAYFSSGFTLKSIIGNQFYMEASLEDRK